ncbi:putative pyridoxal-dependent decarboxylase protein [Phaeoacremonium minimum UCRPA7]|uniref:Putative pyridoxal-dependent decarboxylase protein n=1 Tax=Phaeoacremonium minimum (strain UCR-PA7) TaxID=1286976 RepID=R8BW41_PHAM7|nr:putative pyridoxal-dependent decarboxylase protein [Phaeoacremonium minimum UCRPA7]EOO03540.1 putative pyridoxal-dependent decarboxylase protein [Phaeoacremonium minimum UCRPA7]
MSDFQGEAYKRLRQIVSSRNDDTLPPQDAIQAATSSLPQPTDASYLVGRGPEATLDHLLGTIVPGLNGQNLSGRYYGFVTGSTLPIAEAADNIVSALDQNPAAHLPSQTVCTTVEDAALKMLIDLLELGPPEDWPGRIFTTGATGSNVLGLACGREAVVAKRLRRSGSSDANAVGELGILGACQAAGIKEIRILTSMGHSSLSKAASIVGIGRASTKQLPYSDKEPWRLDIDAVEKLLAEDGVASIISVSAGEVNTGRFATAGLEDLKRLRVLADKYDSWIHVDGAFGLYARALPQTEEFSRLRELVSGLELADSITADGHKLLNVPYDAGIFFCRDDNIPTSVFQNAGAAYLSTGPSRILSPLNIGLENSRRFRALPVYATLLSEGRNGLAEMFARMVLMARGVAEFIRDSEYYDWLPEPTANLNEVQIIVFFRAKNDALNDVLVQKINDTRKMYVSGTQWQGKKACRLATCSF